MHGRRGIRDTGNLRLRMRQGLRLEERQAEPRNSRIENIAPLETVALGFSQAKTKLFAGLKEEGTPIRIEKRNPHWGG